MNIVKVNNFVQSNGNCDYKGLNLSKILAGSQLYPSYENAAYFFYDGEVSDGEEVQLIEQSVYDEIKQKIAEELASYVSPERELEQLKQQVVAQQAAINMILGV